MLVCKMVLGKPENWCRIDDGLSTEAQAPSAPPPPSWRCHWSCTNFFTGEYDVTTFESRLSNAMCDVDV